MKTSIVSVSAVFVVALLAAGCANTIRGMGADTANTVNATQSAGKNVANAAQ